MLVLIFSLYYHCLTLKHFHWTVHKLLHHESPLLDIWEQMLLNYYPLSRWYHVISVAFRHHFGYQSVKGSHRFTLTENPNKMLLFGCSLCCHWHFQWFNCFRRLDLTLGKLKSANIILLQSYVGGSA